MATVDNRTEGRDYLLPDQVNKLKDDVLRIIAALQAVDADVTSVLEALAGKAALSHGHPMSEIVGLITALAGKTDNTHHDALDDLSDVNVTGAANGQVLIRQALAWIPIALQINNVAGLEGALNGKATPADITAAINALVAAAPGTLDTLNELAVALGNDPNFATTITTALAGKLVKAANLSDLVDPVAARGNLKIWTGTLAAYNAIVTKDAATIYFATA